MKLVSTEYIIDKINALQQDKIFWLVDDNTHKYCLPLLKNGINKKHIIIKIAAHDNHKTWQSCEQIFNTFNKHNCNKSDILICLGGGVITDIGGFAASIYKRGIQFIYIPTTLLGMVDAATGGKNGINFDNFKNNIGLINDNYKTYFSATFLDTLPTIQVENGFAEMLKHGILQGGSAFTKLQQLQQLQLPDLVPLIAASVSFKNKIVAKDLYESNTRKMLNYGHTIGHALESYYLSKSVKHKLHGHCVAAGMYYENILAYKYTDLPASDFVKMQNLLLKYFEAHIHIDIDFADLLGFMIQDKKNNSNKINFSVVSKIGQAKIDLQLSPTQIIDGLN